MELFHGMARPVARQSAASLYRPDLASFNMTGYDPRHAEGFIRLFGLPVAVAAQAAGLAPAPVATSSEAPPLDYSSIFVPEVNRVS